MNSNSNYNGNISFIYNIDMKASLLVSCESTFYLTLFLLLTSMVVTKTTLNVCY
jgi:hypothetical protein